MIDIGVFMALLDKLRIEINSIAGISPEEGWQEGKKISTANSPLSFDPTSDSAWSCIVVDCVAGDKFTLTATNDSMNYRVYSFCASDGTILERPSSNKAWTNEIITAPEGATKLVCNSKNTVSYELYKGTVPDALSKLVFGILPILVGNTNSYGTKLTPTEENHIDYDDITEPGNYYCGSSTDAAYLDHCPTSQGNKLIVFATASNSRPFQIVIPNNDNNIYFRSNNSGTYRGWRVIGDKKVTYSDSAVTIQAVEDVRYVCGEVSTLSFTPAANGVSDVRFTSGSTPTLLTLPNTVIFSDGWDGTCEANTTYEINIMDGVYGVVASWT